MSRYLGERVIVLINSTRRKREDVQSSSIAIIRTGSKPSWPRIFQPLSRLICDLYFFELPWGYANHTTASPTALLATAGAAAATPTGTEAARAAAALGPEAAACAATGVEDNLTYVSPRSGRAVSRQAGEPWKDKLLRLPEFLNGPMTGEPSFQVMSTPSA